MFCVFKDGMSVRNKLLELHHWLEMIGCIGMGI